MIVHRDHGQTPGHHVGTEVLLRRKARVAQQYQLAVLRHDAERLPEYRGVAGGVDHDLEAAA